MKKLVFIVCFLFLVSWNSDISAQLSQGGKPESFSMSNKVKISEVSYKSMPNVNVNALLAEDEYNDKIKDQPWRYGQDIEVNYNPKNSGTWMEMEDGSHLWRLGITSRGAVSMGVCFDNFHLPEGAKLFIYNPAKTMILGAYTSLNNHESGYFAISPIMDESLIIEYYEPAEASFRGELNIGRVTHGYRSIGKYTKSFESSGNCNVNAACPEGNPIRDQIKSAAFIIVGGYVCCGALINNTNEDGKPLFLTANHCREADGETVIFWFNWESDSCANPATSPDYNSLTGAYERAYYANSDIWLLELFDTPPSNFNVYYSGWNRTLISNLEEKVWCIHHPNGDIKKISWADGGITTSNYLGETGSGTSHWRVGAWSNGTTTEGGSSGSPLYDSQLRIIGQLHGGYAACGNTLSDWFGKLSTSWNGGGTDSTRLSNWLDPAGLGTLMLDGYDPNAILYDIDARLVRIISPSQTYTSIDTIQPAFIIKNAGNDTLTEFSVFYKLNGVDSTGFNWTGNLISKSSDTVFFPPLTLTSGYHKLFAKVIAAGDENSSNDSIIMEFFVAGCEDLSPPIYEGFDSAVLSPCWTAQTISGPNPALSLVTSGNFPSCLPSQGKRMIEFNSNIISAGSSIRLESPALSTTGLDSMIVNFDWYHDNSYSSAEDRVVVQYSLNGNSWTTVEQVFRYSDSLAGWDRKSILLPDTVDNQFEVYFALLFVSEHGSNCHLDSLVFNATPIAEPYPDFYASRLNISIGDTVIFMDNSANGPYTTYEWDFGDGAQPAIASGKGPHEVVYDTTGFKTVSLVLNGLYTETKINFLYVKEDIFYAPFNLVGVTDKSDVILNWNWKSLSDGFELGDFRLWDEIIEGPGTIGDTLIENGFPFWYVIHSPKEAYNGDYAAKIDWGYNLNTWLISPDIEISGNSKISFTWNSSYSWHVDPNDHGDLFVKISTDDGASWETLWTFGEIGVWDDFAWYETTIDISDYANTQSKIAFNLLAHDNSEVLIDDVEVEEVFTKIETGTIKLEEASSIGKQNRTSGIGGGVPHSAEKTVELVDFSIFRDGLEIGKALAPEYYDLGLKSGSYTYYVIANYLNPDSSSVASNVLSIQVGPGSVTGKKFEDRIDIFPNPSSDGIFGINILKEYTCRITNISGGLVKELKVNSSTTQINISDQQKGMYILNFRSKEENYFLKVVIL